MIDSVKEYFIRCETIFPQWRSGLRRVSLALRRERITTMEQLCRLNQMGPQALLAIRSIGEQRLSLIEAVCRQYEVETAAAASDRREEVHQG